jgi:hypothetical protein
MQMDNSSDSQKAALEMYKFGFERLKFQDEYLFKFNALFITLNGAMAYTWKDVFLNERIESSNIFLIFLALFGVVICLVWFLWIKHNDAWHSVWIGCLISIEKELLGEKSNLAIFSADANQMAFGGGRSLKKSFKGHRLALCIPTALIAGWLYLFIILLKC